MKLDVKFAANDKVIKSNFGEIYEVSDGGYDRGYDDGYKVGEKDGFGNGYDVGLEDGYEAGYNKAESENPMFYMDVKGFQWNGKAFPEGFDFVLKVRYKPSDMNAMLMKTTGLKTVTLVCEADGTVNYAQLVRETTATVLDISGFKPKPKDMSYFALDAKLITIIGALDLSQCTSVTMAFRGVRGLENIEFVPNTIPISIDFWYCTKLTHDSLMSIINGLMDYGVKFYEYDISGGEPACMSWPEMTDGLDTYVITSVGIIDGEGEVYVRSETTGKEIGFYFHREIGFTEEVLNAIKVGNKFVVDATLEYEGGSDIPLYGHYNSFKIISIEGGGATQTLTLGATNLNKLSPEEKAIATEKGWTLA